MDTVRALSCLLTSWPSTSVSSSEEALESGEFGICFARRNSSPRIASAVVTIPFATEAAIHDPPSTGDCGKLESPILMLTLFLGRGCPWAGG